MEDAAMFFVVMLALPYVAGAVLFPFVLLFFFLKEKLGSR